MQAHTVTRKHDLADPAKVGAAVAAREVRASRVPLDASPAPGARAEFRRLGDVPQRVGHFFANEAGVRGQDLARGLCAVGGA